MNSARIHPGFLLLAFVALTACRQDMHDQPRIETLQKTSLFADTQGSRPYIAGTIARGQLKTDKEYLLGRRALARPAGQATPGAALQTPAPAAPVHQHNAAEAKPGAETKPGAESFAASFAPDLVTELPVPVTRELLQRGRERFEIFCVHCHGYTGRASGMIVQRGLSKPPSFHIDRLKQAPVGHFFDVITNGFGAMYSYASRIPVADRWAIIAYVRTLQLSQAADVADVPESERGNLQKPPAQSPPQEGPR